MTVAELDRRITGQELTEWMAFELLEGPLGPRRGDYHAAQISAAVLNAMRGRRGRVAQITDLLIKWPGERPRPQGPQEMLRAIKALNRRLGGRELEGGARGGDTGGSAHPHRR